MSRNSDPTRLLCSLVALTLQFSCVNPLELNTEEPAEILIVEGFIDNDFGPHEIEITWLARFGSVADGGNRRRADAEVAIFDDLGQSTPLERIFFERDQVFNVPPICSPEVGFVPSSTNYLTLASFRGVPGRSYRLEIVLSNGKKYKSTFQELPEAVPIDSVFVTFRSLPATNDLIPVTGVDVFAVWQDDPNTNNFYFWDIDGTYRIETPDKMDGLTCCVYDPRDGLADDCWVIEQNIPGVEGPFGDRLANGNQIIEKIGFIEDDGRRFASKRVTAERQYHLEVLQYAIGEDAFNFFTNIETLSEIDGEIFDPPPIGARGNIISLSDANDIVVGFFGAFGKSTYGRFVDRSILRDVKQHTLCGDCREFANGQLEIPEPYR